MILKSFSIYLVLEVDGNLSVHWKSLSIDLILASLTKAALNLFIVIIDVYYCLSCWKMVSLAYFHFWNSPRCSGHLSIFPFHSCHLQGPRISCYCLILYFLNCLWKHCAIIIQINYFKIGLFHFMNPSILNFGFLRINL